MAKQFKPQKETAGHKHDDPADVRGKPKSSTGQPAPTRDIPPSPNEGRLGPAGDPAEGKRDESLP